MRNSRQLLRGACEAPNAFDSRKALRAIVPTCLFPPTYTTRGRGYNYHSTRDASTASEFRKHVAQDRFVDAMGPLPIRRHPAERPVHSTQPEEATNLKLESSPDSSKAPKSRYVEARGRLIDTTGPQLSRFASQRSTPSTRQEDNALTQVEKSRMTPDKERGEPDVLKTWREVPSKSPEIRRLKSRTKTESAGVIPEPPTRRLSSSNKQIAGIFPGVSIYSALWQVREHKMEMMAAREQFDKGKERSPGRMLNLTPIPYHEELRKHLMSVRNFVHELKDCPDDEFNQLVWSEVSSFVRYTGRSISLEPGKATPSLPMPWAVEDRNGLDGRQLLDEEIRRLEAYLKFSDAEVAARKAVAQEFMTTFANVEGVHKPYKIEQFGSEVTGLALPDSDLDFRASRSYSLEDISRRASGKLSPSTEFRRAPRRAGFKTFKQDVATVTHALDRSGKFGLVSCRADTAFPIINCQHIASGIDIQLIWGGSSKKQEQSTLENLAKFESLRSVYQILRIALAARSLSEPYHGGLGSYGLFCLTAAVFHKEWYDERMIEYTKTAASHPLTKAITLIGTQSSRLARFVVSHDEWPPRFPDFNHRALRKKHMMNRHPVTGARDLEALADQPSIIDPARPTNDLGAKAYAYNYIRSTFKLEAERLVTAMMLLDQAADGVPRPWDVPHPDYPLAHTPDPNPKSLLLPLIGNYHDRVRSRREQAAAYGRKVLSGEIVPPVYVPPPEHHLPDLEPPASPTEDANAAVVSAYKASKVAKKASKPNKASKSARNIDASQFDLVDEPAAPDSKEEEATSKPSEEETSKLEDEQGAAESKEEMTSEPSEGEISKPDDKEAGSTPS